MKLMNFLRFLRAVVTVYILYEIIGYYVHTSLLCDCYTELEGLWRVNMKEKMNYTFIADFVFTTLFVLIYTRWVKKHTVLTGIVFGLTYSLISIVNIINQYVMYPLTKHLVVLWILTAVFQLFICGLSVGMIYRPLKPRVKHMDENDASNIDSGINSEEDQTENKENFTN